VVAALHSKTCDALTLKLLYIEPLARFLGPKAKARCKQQRTTNNKQPTTCNVSIVLGHARFAFAFAFPAVVVTETESETGDCKLEAKTGTETGTEAGIETENGEWSRSRGWGYR